MAHPPVHTHCQNCGTPLEGVFCHRCGQHDFDITQSFRHVFLEALENLFHFDEKFFRNVITLLWRPGVLSADYNAGKRASQMPPFRLYLFVSVLFFFTAFLSGNAPIRQAEPPPTTARSAVATGERSPAEKKSAASSPALEAGAAENASADGRLTRFLREKLDHFTTHQQETTEELAHAFPKILILCLPVFALLTRFLFPAARQSYLQHLIVAVHFHTFIFLWKMVSDGWLEILRLGSARLADGAGFGVLAWFVFYSLQMLRHLYDESWPKTIVKAAALFVIYMITIIACFLAAVSVLFLVG